MKKIIALICLGLVVSFTSFAQANETATQRANRLTDQMVKELRLNNFQANRLREINQDKVNKMIQIEDKYANDLAIVDKNCQGVCKERDKELESFLSSEQYSQYYSSRALYYKSDKDFAATIGADADKNTVKSAENGKINFPVGSKVVPVKNQPRAVLKPNDSK